MLPIVLIATITHLTTYCSIERSRGAGGRAFGQTDRREGCGRVSQTVLVVVVVFVVECDNGDGRVFFGVRGSVCDRSIDLIGFDRFGSVGIVVVVVVVLDQHTSVK